ncbi:MAG: hypothetical protein F6J87_30190 [Spirulina sp. SIO3F2]|nr:hypothetical protein [Spirulina sp. SIO3F2]
MFPNEGMNYRQWLIGQAVSGIAQRATVSHLAARAAVDIADQVIALLDAEHGDEEE